jgi:hypothetical protein
VAAVLLVLLLLDDDDDDDKCAALYWGVEYWASAGTRTHALLENGAAERTMEKYWVNEQQRGQQQRQ